MDLGKYNNFNNYVMLGVVSFGVHLLSKVIGTPRLLGYSDLSKPLTNYRQVPCRRQTAKCGNRNSQTIGIQQS